MEIEMTKLPKTWIIDLDGTILKHNGYKTDGVDSFLEGADLLLGQIGQDDMVIILTSRTEEFRDITEAFLKKMKIRYDHIIYNAPYGERLLINDKKPSGRLMAYAFNPDRDKTADITIRINEEL